MSRPATLVCTFRSAASVKDLIEALGVPHPEIDQIVVNGRPVDFACGVSDGDDAPWHSPVVDAAASAHGANILAVDLASRAWESGAATPPHAWGVGPKSSRTAVRHW